MIAEYIKLRQNSLVMYLVKLSANQLIDVAFIDHFNAKDLVGSGYQRPPIPSHYKKITKYFNEDVEASLPTAILAATHPSNLLEKSLSELEIIEKLTIVDGQHRIEGIKNLRTHNIERYEEVLQCYEFPVIIMAVDGQNKSVEINAFININKKGKPVSTDLAMQLRDKLNRMRTEEKDIFTVEVLSKDYCSIVATEIVDMIGNTEKSTWCGLIKFSDDISRQKPISVSAFAKSIITIVRQILIKNAPLSRYSLDTCKKDIAYMIEEAWKIIENKWERCFVSESSLGYNIRKAVGVYSLHGILEECIQNNSADIEASLLDFQRIIDDSKVEYIDWLEGGRFTGMTNSQSLKKVANIIGNKENF